MENMNLQQILKHWGFEEYIEEFEGKYYIEIYLNLVLEACA